MRRLLLFVAFAGPVFGAGAGLYCVTPTGAAVDDCVAGKTFPQISTALAALVADQGTATFGATQTIRVYPGSYTSAGLVGYITSSRFLAPTATYPLIIRSASGAQAAPGGTQPIINCGDTTSTDAGWFYSPYVTVQGFEITNCKAAFVWGSAGPRDHETIAYNYIHGTGTATAIADNAAGTGTGTWIHHNIITNVGSGIASTYAAWIIEFNEISNTTAGGGIGSAGSCTIRNNIIYNVYITNGSGVQGGNDDVITGNVSYDNRYGIQSQIKTAPGPTFQQNIVVGNMWTCHYEGGTSPVFGLMQHNFCYRSTNVGVPADYGQAQRITGGTGSAAFEINNIAWPNKTAAATDRALDTSSGLTASMSDYNVWWVTGTVGHEGLAMVNVTDYATLAAFQVTGWDTHSINVNPQLLGNPDLLAVTTQVFPECPTIECRLAKIRRNYMPTNLALKGKGCTWSASAMTCTPDHSDIGPVPITVYNAPGITGGGVY